MDNNVLTQNCSEYNLHKLIDNFINKNGEVLCITLIPH